MSHVVVLHSSRPKARKEYQCEECGRKIAKGETYLRQDNVYDGQRYGFVCCEQCRIAWHIIYESIGDSEFYMPDMLQDEFPQAYELFRAKWVTGEGSLATETVLRAALGVGEQHGE